jgi:CBS domain-containing protein
MSPLGERGRMFAVEDSDFLGSRSPYDALGADDPERFVLALEVEYFAAGSTIVQVDGPPMDDLWVWRIGF